MICSHSYSDRSEFENSSAQWNKYVLEVPKVSRTGAKLKEGNRVLSGGLKDDKKSHGVLAADA